MTHAQLYNKDGRKPWMLSVMSSGHFCRVKTMDLFHVITHVESQTVLKVNNVSGAGC